MKVAIWGFDAYGRMLLNDIQTFWASEYEVTVVFDVDYESKPEPAGGVVLCSSAEIGLRFEAGEFDGVFIGLDNSLVYWELADSLRHQKIPVLTLISRDSLVPASTLAHAVSAQMGIVDDGYTCTACERVYAFVHRRLGQELLVYYDGAGHIVRDTWFKHDLDWDVTILNSPWRIDAPPDAPVMLDGEYCAAAGFWGRNYWHFTFQMLDRIAVMEAAGFKGKYILVRTGFSQEILSMLPIGLDRVLWIDDLDDASSYCFERVFFLHLDDYLYHGNRAARPLLRYANSIENTLDKRFDYSVFPSRLFVKRIGTRKLIGAEALLQEYGFATIVPEELSVQDQMAYFRAADVVVTPHGANSTNSLYMRPGSSFVEVFPRVWGTPACTGPLYVKGVHYLSVVSGYDQLGTQGNVDADFRVDRTLLEMAIQNAIQLAED